MKNLNLKPWYVFFMTLISIATVSVAQSTADEQAILKTINDNNAAWAARDFDKWASCWSHESYVASFWGGPNNYAQADDWDTFAESTKTFFQNTNPEAKPAPAEVVSMRIATNMATVRTNAHGTMNLHVLEKTDGQ